MNSLAQLHCLNGRLDAAEPLFGTVVSLARAAEDRESLAIGLINLAMVSIARGDGDPARTFLGEAFEVAAQMQSSRIGQSLLDAGAGLATARAEWVVAARFYGAAQAEAERTGLRRDPADEAFLAPLIARAQGALGSADFAAALAEGRGLAPDEAVRRARDWLATYR
jgi:hypothetical protein